jgi:DHA1 family multidrug resistance protein-like MFS transporter
MIETIRDSAFGKLVRIFSGTGLLSYPEERDASAWRTYLQVSAEAEHEEASTWTGDEAFPESYGLYTVMSQASRRRPRRPLPLKSVLAGPWRGAQGKTPEIIGWGGPDDSEVGHHSPEYVFAVPRSAR